MWRRPLLLGLIVVAAVMLFVLLTVRGSAHFQDDFSSAAATRADWRIVGGTGAVETTRRGPAFRLTSAAPKRNAVALADRGRRFGVEGLTVKAGIRVESGRGGIVFALQDAERLVGYRVEVDPVAHTIILSELNPDGAEFVIQVYRDALVNPKTLCYLSIASTDSYFFVRASFGREEEREDEILRSSQDHQHAGIRSFDGGQVGLYAIGGTSWFDHVSVQGTAYNGPGVGPLKGRAGAP